MANMRKISWFVDRLPGVRPRVAGVAIKNDAVPGAMEDVHFLHGDLGPAFLVGPDAAALILEAYRDGLLPMEAGTHPVATPEIDEHLRAAEALREEADAHRRSRADTDPFTDWRAMEEVFRRLGHPVPGTAVVQGVDVERRASGGSRDPKPDEIRFHWNDAGEARTLDRRRGLLPIG